MPNLPSLGKSLTFINPHVVAKMDVTYLPPTRARFTINFTKLKDAILSKHYELSLVFTDTKLSRKLNRIYRGKDKPTNILSFPVSKKSGEIFIDLVTARREAPKFEMSFNLFVKFLFIHGLLHLKGMDHSAKMERVEKKILYGTSNSSGHRHRNLGH